MAALSNKTGDPRSDAIKMAFQQAFIELVAEHAFDAISISLIACRAGKNRATFYNDYEDKCDLLRACLLEWLEVYCADLAKTNPTDIVLRLPDFTFAIERHYMEARQFYLAIFSDGRFPAFHALFTGCLNQHFEHLIDILRE